MMIVMTNDNGNHNDDEHAYAFFAVFARLVKREVQQIKHLTEETQNIYKIRSIVTVEMAIGYRSNN